MPSLSALVLENPEQYEWRNPLPHKVWQGVIFLESCYPVYRNQEKAGEITVTKQGLYYSLLCRVKLPAGSRYRLYAHTEGCTRDLGLCVPSGQEFILQTRIPIKYFGQGEYSFYLEQPGAEAFIPVSCDRPFPAVDRLESGKFAMRGEKPGIVFLTTEKLSHIL